MYWLNKQVKDGHGWDQDPRHCQDFGNQDIYLSRFWRSRPPLVKILEIKTPGIVNIWEIKTFTCQGFGDQDLYLSRFLRSKPLLVKMLEIKAFICQDFGDQDLYFSRFWRSRLSLVKIQEILFAQIVARGRPPPLASLCAFCPRSPVCPP